MYLLGEVQKYSLDLKKINKNTSSPSILSEIQKIHLFNNKNDANYAIHPSSIALVLIEVTLMNMIRASLNKPNQSS